MEYYGIANPQGVEPTVHLREGIPNLLALGHRGEVLPVFGVEAKLRAFARAHRALKANCTKSFDTALLGTDLFEVAETLYPAAGAGGVELVVFDPVLDADGTWAGEARSCWPAERFCAFLTNVVDIARRREGVPADRRPSPKALRKASRWYVLRLLLYRLGLLDIFDTLGRHLGGKA